MSICVCVCVFIYFLQFLISWKFYQYFGEKLRARKCVKMHFSVAQCSDGLCIAVKQKIIIFGQNTIWRWFFCMSMFCIVFGHNKSCDFAEDIKTKFEMVSLFSGLRKCAIFTKNNAVAP